MDGERTNVRHAGCGVSPSPPPFPDPTTSYLDVPAYTTGSLKCKRTEQTDKSSKRSGQSTTRTIYKLESSTKLATFLPLNAVMGKAHTGSSSSHGSGSSSSQDACVHECTNDYGGTWAPATGGQGSLGSCKVRLALDDFCLKVKINNETNNGTGEISSLEVDNSYPAQGMGCFWDPTHKGFASARYSMEQDTDKQTHGVNFMLRSSHDPWLMYMAKTKGTGSFGMTQAQKFMMGLILLIIGALLCLCWVKVCYFGRKMLSSKSRPEQRPAGAMQGYYYDATERFYKGPQRRNAASMAMQQMPMGMQPPAPYGQPPAPYGQPPAPYGQPPAPYGQPPPATGVPAGYPPPEAAKTIV